MNALCFFKKYQVKPYLSGHKLKITRLSKLVKTDAERVIEYAKRHREEIINELKSNPVDCELCRASGTWDYRQYRDKGLLCFYHAAIRGKAGKPVPCDVQKNNCPKISENYGHNSGTP